MEQYEIPDIRPSSKINSDLIYLAALINPLVISFIGHLLFDLLRGDRIEQFESGSDQSYFEYRGIALVVWAIFYFPAIIFSQVYLTNKLQPEKRPVFTFVGVLYNCLIAFCDCIYMLIASDPTPFYNY